MLFSSLTLETGGKCLYENREEIKSVYMGCALSCFRHETMPTSNDHSVSSRNKFERKLYIAKESPDNIFDLSDCELKHVPTGIFSICKVYRKEHLYLNNNKLENLNHGGRLADLYLINVLNLSSNKFTHLPTDIRCLVNLTELYLQNNHLCDISDEIKYLEMLIILDISNNKLKFLTKSIGDLKNLRKLDVSHNPELTKLCPELCYCTRIVSIQLDEDNCLFPPSHVTTQGTVEIMKYLCKEMNITYTPPSVDIVDRPEIKLEPTKDPFQKHKMDITWEEQEKINSNQNKIHEAVKQQRENLFSKVLKNQNELDTEIAKVQVTKEKDKKRLLQLIQDNEEEVKLLVKKLVGTNNMKPEIIQQQLQHELAEHDHLVSIIRQNYDNMKKVDVLKAMESMIEEEYALTTNKRNYSQYIDNIKQNMLQEESKSINKLIELLKSKDQSKATFMELLLEDQNIQKAVVISLVEKLDSRSWSLNQEIALISTNLAKLSLIEQEKKKLHMNYSYNDLLNQRVQLLALLDDLLAQQKKRKIQLVETLKEMELENENKSDFWLKNYQKVIQSAPKHLLHGSHLDPLLANCLLQENAIHCLPFLTKFLFTQSLDSVNNETLKQSGVTLTVDRESILKAIKRYTEDKSDQNDENESCEGIVDDKRTEIESECVVCMDAECEVVLVPCGHMCCCILCSGDLKNCPMCRCEIERKIKVMTV